MIQGSDYEAIVYSGTTPDDAPTGAQKINNNFKKITFCPPVDTFAHLPTTNNNAGDVRKTLDTGKEYMWDGANWVDYEKKIIVDEIGNATIDTDTIEKTYDPSAPSIKYDIKNDSITNAHIKSNAGIEWSKISKSGSSISDFDSANHNDLDNIQGGQLTERFHLTNNEHDTLTTGSNADGLHIHDHKNLQNIQGGAVNDYYHLTHTQHDTLTTGSNADGLHLHDHKNLENLQGGTTNEYYHLTDNEHSLLVSNGLADSLHKHTHNTLEGLNLGDYQHLTATQKTDLTGGANADGQHLHSHANLTGLQGGASGEFYHLTSDQYTKLGQVYNYTPTSSSDANGNVDDIAYDGSYLYVKTSSGWLRAALSSF